MAFELKITATNAEDLAAHAASLALLFPGPKIDAVVSTDPVMPEVKEAAKPTRTKKVEEPKAEPAKVEEKAVEAEKVEETKADKEEAVQADPEPVVEAKTVNFNDDVMPLMFKLTEKKGRDAVVEVVSMFGVAKGSQVPVEQLGEFAEQLQMAIDA